jgi:chemotaxis methyl-accepting protein methylase
MERRLLHGEEPYTLAMIMDEFFGKDKALWDHE